MRSIKIVLIFVLAVVLVNCGSNVRTAKTTDKDLSEYDTFAYLPNSNAEIPGEAYNDEDINSWIIETINQNMREAGYTLDRDNPDLLVLVSTKVDEKTETRRDPVYATYPYAGGMNTVRPFYNPYYYRGYSGFTTIAGYNTNNYEYEEGTLVIDLVDRETKESVWKGIASENIYTQTTSEAIEGLVEDIFEEYPLRN